MKVTEHFFTRGLRRILDGIRRREWLTTVALLLLLVLAVVLLPGLVHREKKSDAFSVEGDPLDIRLVGIRSWFGKTIYDPAGKKAGELESYSVQPFALKDEQLHEFIFDLPGMDSPKRVDAFSIVRICPSENQSYQIHMARTARAILDGEEVRLAVPCRLPRNITKRLLWAVPIKTQMRKVDLTLRYYADKPLGAVCAFEGPFWPGDIKETKGGNIRLEVKQEMMRGAVIRIKGKAPELPSDPPLIVYDTKGTRYPMLHGSGSLSSSPSGSQFDRTYHVEEVPLSRIARMTFGEAEREKTFRNVVLPPEEKMPSAYAPWLEEMARRLDRQPDTKLAGENFRQNLDAALKIIDVARGYQALGAWEAIKESKKRFEDFPEETRARLRGAADAWLGCEDIQMRTLAVEMGLRFGWPEYFQKALDLLSQIQGGKGPWGLRQMWDGRWRIAGTQGSYHNGFFSQWVYLIANYPRPLTREQMESLSGWVMGTDSVPQPQDLISSFMENQHFPASKPQLLDFLRHPQLNVWWWAGLYLHPRLKQEEIDALPRETKVRLLVVGNGKPPSDASELTKDIQKACYDALMWTARDSGPLQGEPSQILARLIQVCDQDTATSAILAYLGKEKRRTYGLPSIFERMVKQINLWHGVNIGRLGARTVNQVNNPAHDWLDWDQVISDTLEWRRTGRDPGALPEGYRPQPGDLRVIWRNLDDPEKSWIDTWLKGHLSARPPRKQLMWVQEKKEGYSVTGDYLYCGIRLSPKTEGQAAEASSYGMEMRCGIPNQGWTCSSSVPAGSLPAMVTLSNPGNRNTPPASFKWEVWLERADSPESVIVDTAIFKAWRQDPRKGLRFPENRVITLRFPEDRSLGTVRDPWSRLNTEAKGTVQVPVYSALSIELESPSVDLKSLEPLKEMEGSLSIRVSSKEIRDRDLTSLTGLKSLYSLSLPMCERITDEGLANLGGLANLKYLDFHGTRVDGTGLKYLTGLSRMDFLRLSGSRLNDAGISALGGVHKQNLRSLDLEKTAITDQGLASLEGMANLNSLNLSGTSLTGAGLRRLAKCPSLAYLGLAGLPLKDDDLAFLEDPALAKMIRVDLSGTGVGDKGMRHLAGLRELTNLDVGGTKIRGGGLRLLGQLPKLQNLQLSGCSGLKDQDLAAFAEEGFAGLQGLELRECAGITDAGLVHLKGLRNLRSLGLEGASVTKAGMESLRSALPGCDVRADFSSTQ